MDILAWVQFIVYGVFFENESEACTFVWQTTKGFALQYMEPVIITSPTQIKHMVRDTMLEVLALMQDATKAPVTGDADLLSETQALAYLGSISRPTLRKIVATGKVQKYKSGAKRNLYSRAELKSYVLTQKNA